MSDKTMKAVRYHEHGGPEVLKFEDAPIPEPGPDEVLIRVAASTVNPADALLRSGFTRGMQIPLPMIPGMEYSGIIEKCPDGHFKQGEKVIAFPDKLKAGGCAEYAVTKSAYVGPAPKSIPLTDAAAYPAVATTAWQALFVHGDLKTGQRILITNAAGGVGAIAVQLAKWKGAYVIGTASERSFTVLKSFGVDEIIDYKNEKTTAKLTEKVDFIFNMSPVSQEEVTDLLPLVKEGGTFISGVMPADEDLAKQLGVAYTRMATMQTSDFFNSVTELIDSGLLKLHIAERYPLKELSKAHEKVGSVSGRMLIIVNSDLG